METVRIEQLTGINTNAVEGVTQTTPVVLQGFDLNRDGGYYAGFAQRVTPVTVGLDGVVVNHDNFGFALTNNNQLVYDNQTFDVEDGGIAGRSVYLVPRIGAVGHAVSTGEDKYNLGAFVEDFRGEVGDAFRYSSESLSFSSTSGGFSGSYKVLAVYFAPTQNGLVAYDVYSSNSVTISGSTLVTFDTVDYVEPGFGFKIYFAADGDGVFSEYYGTAVNEQPLRFSDGTTGSLQAVIRSDLSSASVVPSDNAIINFSTEIGCVEPHLERVWGKASDTTFVGPFIEGYSPVKRFQMSYPAVDDVSVSNEFFDTSGSTVISGSTDFTHLIEFYDGMSFSTVFTPPASTSYSLSGSHVVDFLREVDDGSGNVEWAFGLRHETSLVRSGNEYTATDTFYWRFVFNEVQYLLAYREFVDTQTTTGVTDFLVRNRELFVNRDVEYELVSGSLDITVSNKQGTELWLSTISSNVTFNGVLVTYNSVQTTVSSALATTSVSGSYSAPATNTIEAVGYDYNYVDDADTTVTLDFVNLSLVTDATTSSSTELRLYASDSDGNFSWTAGSDNSEVWTVDRAGSYKGGFVFVDLQSANLTITNPSTTIVYSDIGYVNFASTLDQYVKIDFTISETITSLVSTPAGLLVFGNNEAFLVRGDPALISQGGFSVQRFSATIGCDAGVRPARLGGNVFTIWQGKLYSMLLGMGDVDFGGNFSELSRPIFDPEDPFVQVASEPRARQIVARTESGLVYRYSTDVAGWLNDPFSEGGVSFMLPNADGNGVRYRLGNELRVVDRAGGAPSVTFENLDLGSKNVKKLFRRVTAFMDNGYSGTPSLSYTIGSSSGSVTGSEEGDGWYVFTLPAGLVNEKIASLSLVMNDANFNDTLEPPIIIDFMPRYSRR